MFKEEVRREGAITFQNNTRRHRGWVYLSLQPNSNKAMTDAGTGVYELTGNTVTENIYRTVTTPTQ